MTPDHSHPHPHLYGALLAIGLALLGLTGGLIYARSLEGRELHPLSAGVSICKNQGAVLARAALSARDLLVAYGGSELTAEVKDKAPIFFERSPSGFAVFAIGKEGTMPLNLLQRIAAAGAAIRERKVVILLSPTWFLRKEVHPRFYDGNFSELQARELLFSPRLSLALKREVAASMLQLPAPLEKRPALRFLLERVARATAWDRAVFLAAAPLGWLENLVAFAQDHWEAVQLIRESSKQKRRSPQARKLDWPALFAEARAHTYVGSDDWKQPEKAFAEIEERGEPAFLDAVAHAQEWERLELLLRTVDELGGRPLLISPPLNGPYLDRLHVTPKARSIFYGRLEEMAARHRMMLVDFRDQENDPKFLADHHDHPSPLGWMWYNRVIDAYYHGGDLGFAREGTGAAR